MPYLEPTYILLKCLLSLQSSQMPDLVKHLSANADSYPNVLCVMSRILATKPHSADVERCVSGNNLLKTSLRSGLNIDTENAYLFIHHNLPPTAAWDKRTSVLKWLKLAHKERPHDKGKCQPYFRHVFTEADGQAWRSESDWCVLQEVRLTFLKLRIPIFRH